MRQQCTTTLDKEERKTAATAVCSSTSYTVIPIHEHHSSRRSRQISFPADTRSAVFFFYIIYILFARCYCCACLLFERYYNSVTFARELSWLLSRTSSIALSSVLCRAIHVPFQRYRCHFIRIIPLLLLHELPSSNLLFSLSCRFRHLTRRPYLEDDQQLFHWVRWTTVKMWCFVSQPNAVVIEVRLDHKAKGLECLEKVWKKFFDCKLIRNGLLFFVEFIWCVYLKLSIQ